MDKEKKNPELIEVPNPLRTKVAYTENGVDLDVLKQAEEVVAAMAEDYVSWATRDMQKMKVVFESVKKKADWQDKKIPELFRFAHDIKGQGGTFGYNLLSSVGDMLCRFIEHSEHKKGMTVLDLQVIELHVQAMEVVLSNQMTDDDAPESKVLLAGLEEIRQKALNA